MTIQIKAIEQYFPVVLFIMLYKVDLTFESVDEILKCDHWNKSYIYQYFSIRVVLLIMLYKVVLPFVSVPKFLSVIIQMNRWALYWVPGVSQSAVYKII